MTLPGTFAVPRQVSVLEPGWIVVNDAVDVLTKDQEDATRQRWLLGPGLTPRRIGHGWWTGVSPTGIHLTAISHGNFHEDVYTAEDTGRHRGWYSPSSGVKEPVFGLDLTTSGAVQWVTTILHVGEHLVTRARDIPEEILRRASALSVRQ